MNLILRLEGNIVQLDHSPYVEEYFDLLAVVQMYYSHFVVMLINQHIEMPE
jgi:hypothetical protein